MNKIIIFYIYLALERFLEQARLYPNETDGDIVANYCISSANLLEVFNLLEGEKRAPNEV